MRTRHRHRGAGWGTLRRVSPTLLIVDDEKTTREGLRAALEDRFDVYLAESAEAARGLMEKEAFDVMLTDLRMTGEDGFQLIDRARALPKPPVCILMTAYGSEDVAVEAMKRGADDYIAKGRLKFEELELRIQRALKRRGLESENRQLHERLDQKYGMPGLVGSSPALGEVMEVIRQVAPTRTTVLITGESGTGKEVVAKTIHQLSTRSRGPWVAVHCAGLPAALLESELFGHEKGAFTGAHERRPGRVELAQGGTLFLDEIGEIDATTQVKLLRFLGERTFERLGSGKTLTADVRLVAATNKDLAAMVKAGTFREDLYFRLAVVPIHLPPLRERVSDIPALAMAFVQEYARENGKKVKGLETAAMEALLRHRWPGNVRELRTAMEHAVVLCRGETVGVKDLPTALRAAPGEAVVHEAREKIAAGGLSWKEAERQLVIHALEACDGNRTEAAKKLGISRRTLHRKIHQFGLEDMK